MDWNVTQGNTSCRSISGSDIITVFRFSCCMFSSSGWWVIGWREWPGLGGCVDLGLQPFLTAIAIFVRFLIILIYIFPYILRIYPYITTPRGLPSSPHRTFSSSTAISTLDLPRIPALSLFIFFLFLFLNLIFSREYSFSSSPVSIVNSSAVVRCSCMHLGLCLSLPRPDTHNTHISHPQDL